MQEKMRDGTTRLTENLTEEQLLERTKQAMRDPEVVEFSVTKNRHERRRGAAIDRRKPKGGKS